MIRRKVHIEDEWVDGAQSEAQAEESWAPFPKNAQVMMIEFHADNGVFQDERIFVDECHHFAAVRANFQMNFDLAGLEEIAEQTMLWWHFPPLFNISHIADRFIFN